MDITIEDSNIIINGNHDLSNEQYPAWDNKTKISSVYRIDCGFDEGFCPECDKEIKQYQVTLLYASDSGIRRALSPCAWICRDCRVALIDEEKASFASSIVGEHEFFHPLGLLTPEQFFDEAEEDIEKHDPSIFSFYEGRKLVHAFDEDGLPILIPEKLLLQFAQEEACNNKKAIKRKKNRKAQKQARKRNRKK